MEKLSINYKQFNIRYAKKEDCAEIMHLIQELADYLKASDKLVIGADTIQKFGFETDPPLYKCIVVEELSPYGTNECSQDNNKQKIVAYAVFNISFSTWFGKGLYLEDIYIGNKYRRQGLGSEILKVIAKIALESDCNNITFFVFPTNIMKDFFISKGAINLTKKEEFDYYKLDKKSLINIVNNQ
ncbi:thialysine N-epsilon-acetyltransferase isoform X1 [Lycorma delicatula]|uniref:thialysine N-epsilon-acetyltransferase isoform X1 n=1 Tax=Lycorma delicatula TaxID=130591 RepID=UPI003F516F83